MSQLHCFIRGATSRLPSQHHCTRGMIAMADSDLTGVQHECRLRGAAASVRLASTASSARRNKADRWQGRPFKTTPIT